MDASRARSFCPRAILCRRRCARLCLSLFFFFFFFYLALIFLFFFVFLFPILYECSASSHGPRAELLLSLEPQKVLSWLSCPARLSSPCPRSALRRPSNRLHAPLVCLLPSRHRRFRSNDFFPGVWTRRLAERARRRRRATPAAHLGLPAVPLASF